MLKFFNRSPELNPAHQIKRIQEKIQKTQYDFDKRIQDIEKFAQTLYRQSEKSEKQVERFKKFCHSFDILISDKDKDLKLLFANETMCHKVYGLPYICSEMIEGRFEPDVINDFIEKTGEWNSFVEGANFNIDKIVKEFNEEKEFIQIGYIGDNKVILKTNIKPYIDKNVFSGVMTISNVINENEFEKIISLGGKMLYDKNKYIVYEI